MDSLAPALAASSPRLSPPPTPLSSLLIHGCVLALWLLLFAASFRLGGVLGWGVGIAYIIYDTVLLLFVGWQARDLLRAPAPQPPAHQRATLGVIVAAYNEAAVLPATLEALLRQTDAPDRILIADDGSDDGTARLLTQAYGLQPAFPDQATASGDRYPALRWLRLPHGGKARALNAAALQLDTQIVLTVDADTLLEPGAIAAFRRAFAAEPELVAATGVLTPVCGNARGARTLQWFQTYEYIRNFLSRYAWMRVDSLLLISGAFAGFRREALLAVGGFDPECLVEDYELIHRLRRHAQSHGRHWTFRVLGGAQARTDAPATIPAFLRQRRRWFGGFLQTQYWYRSLVGDRRYGLLGTLMLPVKAVDTLQPLYGLTAFGLLLTYLLRGQLSVLAPVSALIGAKIAVDIAYHLASVRLYRRWVGDDHRASFGAALLAALAEPFTFQLLRHSGAALGWWAFLAGRDHWGRQTRQGALEAAESDA
ncbi:MAG: glycosyltransferase family 2 protein [Nevskia sp.]|nr:glycosyltransferase family 2 protein [Nevskia sp.]